MQFVYLYLISIPIFLVVDLLWLGIVAKNFYWDRLGYLFGELKWVPVIIFYALFLLGLTYFVTYPNIGSNLTKIILVGGFFGLVTYATYDLVNHGTIKDWPFSITVVDLIWGTFLSAFVSLLTILIYRHFFVTNAIL